MDPVSTAIVSWLGEWATVAVAGSVLNGITTTVSSDEMMQSLKVATIAAQDSQRGYGLFSGCAPDGRKGIQEFLGQFTAIGQVQRELQKPLCEAGKPDVEVLVAAFRRQLGTKGNERIQADCKLDFLEAWMVAFVDAYFGEIQGIRFQVAKEQYLKQLAQRVRRVKFAGIAVSDDKIPEQKVLKEVFVMPDVREQLSEKNPEGPHSVSIEGRTPQENLSSLGIPAQEVLNKNKNRAILLGEPGSGKTILMNHFALTLTLQDSEIAMQDAKIIGLEGKDWLPVMVSLRDWIAQPRMGLLEYLQWYARESLSVERLPVGFFEHWLDRGNALILLDGLDEVVSIGQRKEVTDKIDAFLNRYHQNPAIITSRPAGYSRSLFSTDEFSHYTLEPFDEKQQDALINKWYYNNPASNKVKTDQLKVNLQKELKGNDRIQKLAKNPLLLTIIMVTHRDDKALPRQRFDLYETAVETLLKSREGEKSEQELKLDKIGENSLSVLKKVAYWIHTQGNIGDSEGGTSIDKDDLILQIRDLINCREDDAEECLEFIRKRTGLIEREGDRYAFVHKTFQEYLTAAEIFHHKQSKDEVILDHIRDHLHDGHWREVLLLLVSKLKKKRAAKAIETVLKAGSEYEKWLHRDLLFAGWCLTEDSADLKAAVPELVGEILDRLVAIEIWDTERNGDKAREEASKIIHRLGGTAFQVEIWKRLNDHAGTIDRFRLIEFQASLGQEKRAIEILLSLSKDNEVYIRSNAARSLVKLGNPSLEVVNGLLSLFKDDDNDYTVRLHAAESLINLGNPSLEVVNGLLSLFKDGNFIVRPRAALLLVKLGNTSLEVVNGLLSFLTDDDFTVRLSAAKSLIQLGNTSLEVVNELLSFLTDDDFTVRLSAAESLVSLGNTSLEVVNGLLNLLTYGEAGVLYRAATLLCVLGNTSLEVVNGLLSLMTESQSALRLRAAESLVALGNPSSDVVNGLLSLLTDSRSNVRSSAILLLAKLGNTSLEVVNGLLNLLTDDKANVRSHTAELLVKLGSPSLEVVSGLLTILSDSDSALLRLRAAESLVKLGNPSLEVMNGLLSLLADSDSALRLRAAESLVKLGNPSLEVMNGLLSLLADDETAVRYHAVGLLVKLGSPSLDVVNGLLALLSDSNSAVRLRAVEALVGQGNSSLEVMNGLLSLLADDEIAVRFRAAELLVKLGNISSEVVKGLLSSLTGNDLTIGFRRKSLDYHRFSGRSDPSASLPQYSARYRLRKLLGRLSKKTETETILLAVVQWIEQEQQTDGVPIGETIDVLWAIVVE